MKRKFALFLCALICALLILFNPDAMDAAREGFALWRDSVMPALLPFFVCTTLMRQMGALQSGNCAALFALAFVSGAPGGARLTAQYATDGEPDAGLSALAAALNTISPMYIAGAFATGMLGVPQAALPILIAQFLAALLCVLLARKAYGPVLIASAPEQALPFARLFVASIAESVSSLLSICGTIIFFLVFMRLLAATGILAAVLWPFKSLLTLLGGNGALAEALFTGMLEVTSGSKALAELALPLRTTASVGAFFFSFGGLCVAAQSILFLPVKAKEYFPLKLVQGVLAALLCYLLFPLCFPGAAHTGTVSGETLAQNALTATAIFAVSLLGVATVLLFSAVLGRRRRMRK